MAGILLVIRLEIRPLEDGVYYTGLALIILKIYAQLMQKSRFMLEIIIIYVIKLYLPLLKFF